MAKLCLKSDGRNPAPMGDAERGIFRGDSWRLQPLAAWAVTFLVLLVLLCQAYQERCAYLVDVEAGQVPDCPAQLAGDANGYYHLVMQSPFPCIVPERPPLFLALGRLALAVFGDLDTIPYETLKSAPGALAPEQFQRHLQKNAHNQHVLRKLNILYSLIALVGVFALGLVVAGRFVALTAAALWAFYAWDVFYAVSFLREDLALALDVLTVALLLLLLRCPGSALRRRWALAGGLALSMSLSALTRESTMVILGMLLAAYNLSKAVFRRWDQHDANLTLAVIGAVLLFCMPTLVNNVVATGTVSPQLDAHAKWWATHEFAGQPGFPTRADVCRGIYFDGELTMFEYMFRLRSVPQAVFGYVKGYWNAFTFDLPRRYSFVVFSRTYHMPWLAMLVPVGMLLCLWQRGDQGLLLVLCALIVLFRFAFVLPLNLVLSAEIPADPPGVEARFILPLVPFSFVFGAIAVGDTGRWLRLRITVWTGSGCHAAGVGQRTPAARFVRLPRNGSI